jgi:hypothetical protein
MDRILDVLLTPAVGYVTAGIILLAILLRHFRQMALIRSGLIKKTGLGGRRVDRDNLFGGLVLLTLGGVIAGAKFFDLTFWLGFWIFTALLGLNLIIMALFGRERRYKAHRD